MAEAESKPAKSSGKSSQSGSADAHVAQIKAEGQEALDTKVASAERLAEYETPEEAGLSRQAQFSTYSEKQMPEQNPPLGSHVEQELGEPAEGPVPAFTGLQG